MTKTWADEEMERLDAKGRDNWDESDYEAYHYIMQVWFESGYYDQQ